MTLGLNILAQFVNNRAALLDWIDAAQPGAVVVMDDPSFASAIRVVSPTTTVIHRSYDPHEHEWHTHTTPQAWLNRYLPHVQGGNVLQVFNEPQGYGDLAPLVAWCVEIMDRCPPDVRLCLPNFGVGHPKEDFAPQLDDLLRAFQRHPRHILGLHEYFQSDPIAEPYHTGRFRALLARCTQLGIPHPRIVITEAGRDVGGGINDGWRAVLDEATYATRLLKQASVYDNTPVIGMCVFCYGIGGGGSWRSFDVEGAGTVLRVMQEYNERNRQVTQTIPAPTTGGIAATATKMPGAFVNIRHQPGSTGTDGGDLILNAAVTYFPNYHPETGWVYVQSAGGNGWVSLQGGNVAFTPDAPPLPDPMPEPPPFPDTVDAADNLIVIFKGLEVAADDMRRYAVQFQDWLDSWKDRTGDPDQ